ncbi:Splicing factor U2AF subunit [Glycine max]|nr:Splicing factor U2AF subunit [Glycine max]
MIDKLTLLIQVTKVSTNGSSGHHHRHGGSTSGLGGYSPRKRKSEAAVKTPSPSKHSVEKKRAGLDLPPAGTNNPSAVVSSSFLVSNCAVLSNNHDVILTSSLDLALAKPLPLQKDKGQALVEFLTVYDASAALSFEGIYVTYVVRFIYLKSTIFIGGISNHLSSEMLMEIAGSFGSLKAYHFETKVSNGSCAFLEPSVKYVDHSVTIKACAGLNGMKLGGEVLTVLQAMPDASPSENAGEPPSYGIPEHAEPLLRKPTQVLEINNVLLRFGTIKSINVVKHSSDENLATKLEECEVINKVDAKDVSQESRHKLYY